MKCSKMLLSTHSFNILQAKCIIWIMDGCFDRSEMVCDFLMNQMQRQKKCILHFSVPF